MKTPKPENTAIIIPAFNEVATIATVVGGVTALGQVIVVNDGSSDGTEKAATAAGATVITLQGNQGYEGALTSGIRFAVDNNFDFALTMDGDGQHRPESVQHLLASIQDSDVAIGIRQNKQRVMELVAGWIGTRLWGIDDPFSGLKLYRVVNCKALGDFDSRQLVGAEMFVRARRHGLALKAIPIQTAERSDAPRFGSTLRANFRIARATILLVAISLGILK